MPERLADEATNETIFRAINEWAEQSTDERIGISRGMDTYLCECSDRTCTQPIFLTRSEYEDVRANATRFAIAQNHENPELDRVIFEGHRFTTVEKFYGVGKRIANASNPRRAGDFT